MPKKAYDIRKLADSTALTPEKSINLCGSRRAYFDKLENFESGTRQLLDTLGDATTRRAKNELANPLRILQKKLLDISEEGLSEDIEIFLIAAQQERDDSLVFGSAREILKRASSLCRKIRESEVEPSPEDEVTEESGQRRVEEERACATVWGESATTDVPRLPGRGALPKARPRSVFFSNLLGAIERFEYDTALSEIKTLSNFSYDEEIDGSLEKISACLTGFNYTDATALAKDLFSYVAVLERESRGKLLKKKILAIDDVPDVLNLLKTMLCDDYNIYCVTSHTAAIKFLSSNTPDLILLDIEMPQMDGFELLKIIRRMSPCRKTPVVFLTGNVSVENVKTSVELGGNDFIKKPVDYNILMRKLEKHLGE